MTGPRDRYRVDALAKGLRILQCFTEERPRLHVSELSTMTGIPLATAFRLAATLEAEGFLRRSPGGELRPSAAILTLGHAALGSMSVVEIATSHLEQLAADLQETVNLGVLHGAYVLYLIRLRNSDLVTANIQVGSRLPAANSSMGKVLLAHLSVDERDAALPPEALRLRGGRNALRDRSALELQLAEIVRTGYGIQDEEAADGLRSIAAPVVNRRGTVVAAVNIAVSTARYTRNDLVRKFSHPLLDSAAAIGWHLGERSI